MNAQKNNGKIRRIAINPPLPPLLRAIVYLTSALILVLGQMGSFGFSVTGSSTVARAQGPSEIVEQTPQQPTGATERTEEDGLEKDEDTDDQSRDSEASERPLRVIGATARILERQSGIMFTARVDTGATTCSLHVDQILIEEESERMLDNIGKTIRFSLVNGDEQADWCLAKIEKVVRIKTAEGFARRYKVRLNLQWKDMQKRVLVILNDGDNMEYPLLLGRNFLRGDFLVDVNRDNPETPQR